MPSLDGTVADWMRSHRATVSTSHLGDIGVSDPNVAVSSPTASSMARISSPG